MYEQQVRDPVAYDVICAFFDCGGLDQQTI